MKNTVCSNLSKALRKSLGKRSLPLRKGDTVKVMRGKFFGKEAKVIGADKDSGRVLLENITKKKADGTEKNIGIHASNLQVIEIEEKDEKRFAGKTAVKAGKETRENEAKKAPQKEVQKEKVAKKK